MIKKIKNSGLYNNIISTLNLIFLGRYKVIIETPQFIGSSGDKYMLRQQGWLYITNCQFIHDKNNGGKHDVYFKNMDDAYHAVVKWL